MINLLATGLSTILANGAATTKMLGTILSVGVAVPALMLWRSRRPAGPTATPSPPSVPVAGQATPVESAAYRHQLRELGAILPELVIETDPEGWINFVEASSGRWSGLPAAEALEGTLLVDLVDNSQHPSFREFCTRVLRNGPQGPRVFRLRRPGNIHLPVRVVAAPLLETDGRSVRGIRAVFTDVSGELLSRRELDHRRTAANAITDILRHIAAANAGELDEALTRALISVDGLTTIDRCFLGRLGDDGRALDWKYQWCSEDVEEIPTANLMDSLDNYPWLRERLISGSVVHVEDVAALPRDAWAEKVQWLQHETRSALAVPLVSNDRIIGLLAFHSVRSPGGWRAEDINLLETVAGLLATAWQRRQDLEALQREQEHVRRINADLERSREGLRRVISSQGALFRWRSRDEFAAGVLDELVGLAVPRDSVLPAGAVSGLVARAREGSAVVTAGRGCFAGCEDMALDDVVSARTRDMFDESSRQGRSLFYENSWVADCHSESGERLLFHLQGSRQLDHLDRDLVRIYMAGVEMAFRNARLSLEIIEAQKEMIHTLGEVVETRSRETAHHVLRVGEMAGLLGELAGLDHEESALLRLAAPMHDVGKVGIPDAILKKPGRLTEIEYVTMRNHAVIGHAILAKSQRRIMQVAARIALEHHERWDGTGYPHGKRGEEIHLHGRITALVDVFDALTNRRVYRGAMSLDEVVALIGRERGGHFDPRLVDLFMGNLAAFQEIAGSHPDAGSAVARVGSA